jgi:hypothetical protein
VSYDSKKMPQVQSELKLKEERTNMELKRMEEQKQSFIPLGMFRLRLPFIHYRLTLPEALIGLIVSFIYFIPVALYTDIFGLSLPQAYALIHISLWLMLLHGHFGDYAIGGWVTAALPLIIVHVTAYPAGPERAYALIALQLWLAVIVLFLGLTGLAKKAMEVLPQSLKAGILLGAGIAGFWTVLSPLSTRAQTLNNYPWGIGVSSIAIVALIWSYPLLVKCNQSKVLRTVMPLSMPIGFLIGALVGTIAGEIPPPEMLWGFVQTDYSFISSFSILGLGFPPVSYFATSFTLALLIYIIAYGDFVFIETIVKAGNTRRPDEDIDINGGRAHVIVGVRNLIHSFIAPHPILAGPSYTAYSAIITDRWQKSKDMRSLYDGLTTSAIFLIIGSYLGPIISLVGNSLNIALALGLVLQGFVCAYVGISMLKYVQQAGVAMCMAMVLATRGATWGLAVGVILYFLLEFRLKREDRFEEIVPQLLMEKQDCSG